LNKDFTQWLMELLNKLQPQRVYVNADEPIVGYVWNNRKKYLYFISQREANKLDRQHIVWKPLGEDWK